MVCVVISDTESRVYALALLLVIYVLNNVDRQIVNILAEPIRKDLGLRDSQIGMMTGLSFALLYATLGVPIARLAERGSRPLSSRAPLWSGAALPSCAESPGRSLSLSWRGSGSALARPAARRRHSR